MARVAIGLYVCLFIVAMDVVAGILGIQAEIAQNKVSELCDVHGKGAKNGKSYIASIMITDMNMITFLVILLNLVFLLLFPDSLKKDLQAKHIRVSIFECKEPSHRAFKLGLAAASILAIAHVIANLVGGCICVCSKDQFFKASANRQLAVLFLFVLWIIAFVGLSMLIIGAMANSKSKGSCGFSHHHLMSIGGILCFVHGLFSVIYYASTKATKGEEVKRDNRGSTGGA